MNFRDKIVIVVPLIIIVFIGIVAVTQTLENKKLSKRIEILEEQLEKPKVSGYALQEEFGVSPEIPWDDLEIEPGKNSSGMSVAIVYPPEGKKWVQFMDNGFENVLHGPIEVDMGHRGYIFVRMEIPSPFPFMGVVPVRGW